MSVDISSDIGNKKFWLDFLNDDYLLSVETEKIFVQHFNYLSEGNLDLPQEYLMTCPNDGSLYSHEL